MAERKSHLKIVSNDILVDADRSGALKAAALRARLLQLVDEAGGAEHLFGANQAGRFARVRNEILQAIGYIGFGGMLYVALYHAYHWLTL